MTTTIHSNNDDDIESTEKMRKLRRNTIFVPFIPSPDDDDGLVIDSDDYHVVEELFQEGEVQRLLVVEVHDGDEERRVHTLRVPAWATSLPASIGRLDQLTHLEVQYDVLDPDYDFNDFSSNVSSLPPSIGQLKNLKCLDLNYAKELAYLPEEIGNLASLEKLNLSGSDIVSLPPSIGELNNLKDLNLSMTVELFTLPEEIGNLASLEILDLHGLNIRSIPPSIGKLKNLKDLNLSITEELFTVPEEIGNLASLERLYLRRSNISGKYNTPLQLSITSIISKYLTCIFHMMYYC